MVFITACDFSVRLSAELLVSLWEDEAEDIFAVNLGSNYCVCPAQSRNPLERKLSSFILHLSPLDMATKATEDDLYLLSATAT